MRQMAVLGISLVILGVSVPAMAGDKGHGAMPGMSGESSMKGHGSVSGLPGESRTEGHGMMALGDKVFEGKVGPWSAEIRLVDMMAQMAKVNVSGKIKAKMKNTYHLSVFLTDPGTKKHVTEGKGSVTVTGPDKTQARYDFTGMQGHFGADIKLKNPGKYEFSAGIESGGKKGTAAFPYTIQ